VNCQIRIEEPSDVSLGAFLCKRIKQKTDKLDERMQFITYRAVSAGFYLMLLAILWFYTMELVVEGTVSVRTVVELFAGIAGYLGAFAVLNRRY